jgi:hypothetical protein
MLLALGGEKATAPSEVPAQTSESIASEGTAEHDQGNGRCKSWEEIEISFLSDERIRITEPKRTQTLNYAEFGFEDGRTGKPTRAWKALLILAKNSGPITESSLGTDMKWSNFEKRMGEIRRLFRKYFGLPGDPLPYVKNTGYQARFKISCGPSFET